MSLLHRGVGSWRIPKYLVSMAGPWEEHNLYSRQRLQERVRETRAWMEVEHT